MTDCIFTTVNYNQKNNLQHILKVIYPVNPSGFGPGRSQHGLERENVYQLLNLNPTVKGFISRLC
jgi:hypothetical protein